MKKVFLITISLMFVVLGCGGQESDRSFSPKPPSNPLDGNSVKSGNTQLDNTKRLALVIGGNSKYSDHSLKTPINDAKDMKKTLEKLNFKVLEYENLNQVEMKKR